MIAISRFRVPASAADAFLARAEAGASFYRTRPGCVFAVVQRNLDEPDLWALVSHWENVGSYRRAYNGYEAKVVLTPLMTEAIDEPGAYDDPAEAGENVPRSR